MIATLFTVVLLIVSFTALIAAIVIFTPFGVLSDFAVADGKQSGNIALYWFHPRVLRFSFDIGQRCGTLHMLRWSRKIERRTELKSAPADRPSPASAEKKHSKISTENRKANPLNRSDRSETQKLLKPDQLPQKKSGFWFLRWGLVLQKAKKILSILLDRRLVRRMFRWLRRNCNLLLHLVRLHHVHLKATAGFADPAETGNLYGWFVALRSVFISRTARINIRFEPYFNGALLEVEGSFGVTTSLAQLLVAVFVALVTFPWLAIYNARRNLRKVRTEPLPAAGSATA